MILIREYKIAIWFNYEMSFLYVIWNYTQVKRTRLSAIEAELKRARKKYKDAIVDIKELPIVIDRESCPIRLLG